MIWALALSIFASTHLFTGCQGLKWLQNFEDGAEVTRCVGDKVAFPWSYALEDEERFVGISWNVRYPDAEVNIGSLFLDKFSTRESRLSQIESAGIELSDLRANDTALYTVNVRLNGVTEVATQRADLLVAEMPETLSGRLDVFEKERVTETTQGGYKEEGQQLVCGQFTHLGSPAVSVVWEDPDGNVNPSSGLVDGFFTFDLEAGYKGGKYYCLMNLSSDAVGCLPENSALREKIAVTVVKRIAPSKENEPETVETENEPETVETAGLSTGAVVGIIIALLVVIVVVVAGVLFFLKFRRGKSYSPKEPDSPGPMDKEASEPLKA